MYGICGVYHFEDALSASREAIQSVCRTLTHRGLDDEGIYINEPRGVSRKMKS